MTVANKDRILLKLKTMMLRVATMDAWPKDPDPKNWRTIEGTHVHLKNGKIDGGAGGKFNGHYWTGKQKHNFMGPKIPAQMPGAPTNGWKNATIPKIPQAPKKMSSEEAETSIHTLKTYLKKLKVYGKTHSGDINQVWLDKYNEVIEKFKPFVSNVEYFNAQNIALLYTWGSTTMKEATAIFKDFQEKATGLEPKTESQKTKELHEPKPVKKNEGKR